MRRIFSIIAILGVLSASVSGCISAPTAKKSTTVNVAAVIYPGGGAPPSVLAMYKAALEVNRTSEDFQIRIASINPTMPEPGVYIEKQQTPPTITALEQALGQDPPPEVVLFPSLYEFYAALEKDLLQPLDTYVRGDRNAKPDDYFPGALEAVSDGGRLYALPINIASTVLMYDKRVFDEAGLGAPESNWNWSTFLGYARQLTKVTGDPQNDRYAINLNGPMLLPAFIWQNGGDLVSKDGKRSLLNEPAAIEAVKFYADLIHTYKVVPPEPKMGRDGPGGMIVEKAAVAMRVGPGEIPPLWSPAGRVAMMVSQGAGSQMGYMPFMMRGSQERPMRLAELPRGKVPATMLDVYTVIGLTPKAVNASVAYKAMVALATEMQKELAVPARRSMAKNLRQINPNIAEDDSEVILSSLEHARVVTLMTKGEAMQAFYEKLLQPIMQQTKPIDEAVKETSDAIDEVLNR